MVVGGLMRILALDTATPDLVTGVVDAASGAVEENVIEDTRLLSEQLMPAIEKVTGNQHRDGYEGIEAIAVGVGPGPFTGLRAGMATASALGQALSIPVHGVCTHDAVAYAVAHAIAADTTDATLLVATDARRKEIYFATYRIEAGQVTRMQEPGVVRPEVLQVDSPVDLISIPEHLIERLPAHLRDVKTLHQRPTAAGLVAAADLDAQPAPLVPLYLRRPDAKEPAAKPRSAAIPEVEL